MVKKSLKTIVAWLLCIMLLTVPVFAEDKKPEAVGVYVGEKEISVYVNNLTDDVQEATCQIGTAADQAVRFENIQTMALASKTLVMIDNSFSISMANREKTKAFLDKLIIDLKENEQMSIMTFGEDYRQIVPFTSDRLALSEAADQLVYQDQETKLRDVLCNVLQQKILGEEDCFKRIILIGDGVNNQTIGYTKEELHAEVKKYRYPIYTFGSRGNNNGEELGEMFALSRMSGGLECVLDDCEASDLAAQMRAALQITHFVITPDAELNDGAEKNIHLVAGTAGQSGEVDFTIKMPVQAGVKPAGDASETASSGADAVTSSNTASANASTSTSAEASAKKDTNNKKFDLYIIIPVALAALLLIAVLVYLMVIRKKKKETTDSEVTEFYGDNDGYAKGKNDDNEITEMIDESEPNTGEITEAIWNTEDGYLLVVSDVNRPEKRFEQPFDSGNRVIIGRLADKANLVIDYDRAVSNPHCQIFVQDNKFYIEDFEKTTNKTKLNGERISKKTEIISGDELGIGRSTLKIEINKR